MQPPSYGPISRMPARTWTFVLAEVRTFVFRFKRICTR